MRNRYCTGCLRTFDATHLLYNHRRTFRCGGRFNSLGRQEQIVYNHHRKVRLRAALLKKRRELWMRQLLERGRMASWPAS